MPATELALSIGETLSRHAESIKLGYVWGVSFTFAFLLADERHRTTKRSHFARAMSCVLLSLAWPATVLVLMATTLEKKS